MKIIPALALVLAAAPTFAQPNVAVSIGINQPGVYGRVNISNLPAPALFSARPVLIAPPRVVVERRPIYLYVPAAHQAQWGRYCGRYAACGQPVYFVRDDWVRERYEHEHPGWNNGRHRGWDKHDKHHDNGHGKGHKDKR